MSGNPTLQGARVPPAVSNGSHWDWESALKKIEYPGGSIPLIFGSSSSGRRMIIDALGWKYTQMSPDINEKAIRVPDPMQLPLLIAKAKAEELVRVITTKECDQPQQEYIIITLDEVVGYRGAIREKPESEEEARGFLKSYSNDCVQTFTAVVVTHYPSLKQSCAVEVATVRWTEISEQVIASLIAEGRVFKAAGGFMIDDPALNPLVIGLDGTADAVIGLPVEVTARLISDVVRQL